MNVLPKNRLTAAAAIAGACFLSSAPPTLSAGKPGGTNNKKDIPVTITLDDNHTNIDGSSSGIVNGITSDGSNYTSSNLVSTGVGRNRNVWLIFSDAARSVNINLGSPLGSAGSVGVDLVQDVFDGNDVTILSNAPDGNCDHCYYDPGNPSPLRPQPPTGVFAATDPTFTIVMGEDLDDLSLDCLVETNARLDFGDNAGNEWRLVWGPRQVPGGHVPDPRSAPIRMLRTNANSQNSWIFQTTGDHQAALYRRVNPQSGYFEYFGQFTIPYSGIAQAVSYNPDLIGNHCDLNVGSSGAGWVPPTITLDHDSQTNILTAIAIDHCDDFSTAPTSFDWWADGSPVPGQTGVGNTLDLSLLPDANTITVFAAHPDWLAMLPNLETILRVDIEGSASFLQGGGNGGPSMSVAPLAWSFPRRRRDIQVTITIVDSSGDPVPGIDVVATLTNDDPSFSSSFNGTTNSNGQLSSKLRSAPNGQWCVTINDVQDPDGILSWDEAQPAQPCTTK